MITCSRCGKENQDHYKFCLGCGNEIKAVAKPAREPAPLETARTMLPPERKSQAGMLATEPTPLPSPATAKKGGIPWGDSPKMPAPLQPNGIFPGGAPLEPTPAPVTTSSGGSSSAAGTWASRPTSGAQMAAPQVAQQPTPFPQTGGLTPGPSARVAPSAPPPSVQARGLEEQPVPVVDARFRRALRFAAHAGREFPAREGPAPRSDPRSRVHRPPRRYRVGVSS